MMAMMFKAGVLSFLKRFTRLPYWISSPQNASVVSNSSSRFLPSSGGVLSHMVVANTTLFML